MIRKNIDACCTQQTWFDENFIKEVYDYAIIYHGLKEQTYSRGQNGVAIILSPTFAYYLKLSGSLPSIISQDDDIDLEGFFGIKLNFKVKVKNKDAFRQTYIQIRNNFYVNLFGISSCWRKG